MVNHSFYVQNPETSEGSYLIDKILAQCNEAIAGGAAFAFMSSGGVNLLIRDSRFLSFLENHDFHLIVGVDAITDDKAVDEVKKVMLIYKNLKVDFFITKNKRSIFHPKFVWFQKEKESVHIVGSGNLTSGGLRWNVEAYSILTDSTNNESSLIEWKKFLDENKNHIYKHDNEKVISALSHNTKLKQALLKLKKGGDKLNEIEKNSLSQLPIEEDLVPPYELKNEILIAEIPRNGDRLQQVNFDKNNFINFFGASDDQGENVYVYFFHITHQGLLQAPEVRPAVVVKSHNFRFELNAVKGMIYPKEGKPIGLYLKVASKSFLYMVYLPTDKDYPKLQKILNDKAGESKSSMRRIVFTAQDILEKIPKSPIWNKYEIT
ncbi:phospholipase D family protein [Franconibacter daqui]|uniref:Phospholipase D family protein n=1 Tax=Franconibacter daqui TaxID=2047724 RepID=A0ABV1PT20_9ENTR